VASASDPTATWHFTNMCIRPIIVIIIIITEGSRGNWASIFIIIQEMKELAALAYRDTTAENREFWKNEMGQALREIQGVYEDKMDTMRNEIEASYSLKVTKAQFTPPTTS